MARKFKKDEIEQIKAIAQEVVEEIIKKLNERKQAAKKPLKKENQ